MVATDINIYIADSLKGLAFCLILWAVCYAPCLIAGIIEGRRRNKVEKSLTKPKTIIQP